MKELVNVMENWNRFIKRYSAAQDSWERMRKEFEQHAELFDKLPGKAQQLIGRTLYKAPFEVMAKDLGMLFWHVDRYDEYLIPDDVIDSLKEKEEEDAA